MTHHRSSSSSAIVLRSHKTLSHPLLLCARHPSKSSPLRPVLFPRLPLAKHRHRCTGYTHISEDNRPRLRFCWFKTIKPTASAGPLSIGREFLENPYLCAFHRCSLAEMAGARRGVCVDVVVFVRTRVSHRSSTTMTANRPLLLGQCR